MEIVTKSRKHSAPKTQVHDQTKGKKYRRPQGTFNKWMD